MGNKSKNERLIEKLAMLEMGEKSIRRNLNTYYVDKEKRTKLFAKLHKIQKDIERVKFKLRIEREIRKNDKDNFTS